MSPVLYAFLMSLAAGVSTGLGALPVLLRKDWSRGAQRLMLAAAGGMMLGASFFSLILPGIEHARAGGATAWGAMGTVGTGVLLGAAALWALHGVVPHEHFTKGREGPGGAQLGRHALLVLAVALHNLPEGLSVGIASAHGDAAGGAGLTLGIAAQNVPEGLAVATALVAGGTGRARAALLALLTGLVEPLGGLAGAVAVTASAALLPWGLAFAAGAMLFVVSGEVLAETHVEGAEGPATFAVVAGLVLMMALSTLVG